MIEFFGPGPFGNLARWIVENLPANSQRDAALRSMVQEPVEVFSGDAVRGLAAQLLEFQKNGGKVCL